MTDPFGVTPWIAGPYSLHGPMTSPLDLYDAQRRAEELESVAERLAAGRKQREASQRALTKRLNEVRQQRQAQLEAKTKPATANGRKASAAQSTSRKPGLGEDPEARHRPADSPYTLALWDRQELVMDSAAGQTHHTDMQAGGADVA